MVILYGYSLPGDALFSYLTHLAPTREGLLQGLVQAWRLVLLLLLLDVLVLRLPIPDVLTGLRSILRPLARLGMDRDRVSVRLALTMEAMERPRGWAGMRELLAGHVQAQAGPSTYVIAVRPYRATDWLVLGMLTLGLLWLYA
jgi:energy-coupling factor transport system permease protein